MAKTFPSGTPLTKDDLPGLTSAEQEFVIHQHGLMRIDNYCETSIPVLDAQFSDLKRHLRGYRTTQTRLQLVPKANKAMKGCAKSIKKTQEAWDQLVLELDAYSVDRRSGVRDVQTIFDTHEAVKLVCKAQSGLRSEVMKLDRAVHDRVDEQGNLLLKLDRMKLW